MDARLFGGSTKKESSAERKKRITMGVRRNLSHLQSCLEYLNQLNSKDYPITIWEAYDTKWRKILSDNKLSGDDLYLEATNLANYTWEILAIAKNKKWENIVNANAEIIKLCLQIQTHIEGDEEYTSHIQKMIQQGINLPSELKNPETVLIENLDKRIQDYNEQIRILRDALSSYEKMEQAGLEAAAEARVRSSNVMRIN